MNLLKQYFNTPKMPLVFYYTPYVAVHVVMVFNLLADNAGFLRWFWTIFTFLLGSYTYAWLSDYMLYTSQNNFVRYIFAKSVIFRSDFGTIVKNAHATNKQNRAFKIEGNKIREDNMLYVKRTFVSIVGNVIGKFILAFLLYPIFIISIFTHPIIIKKYKEVALQEEQSGMQ
ncbi:MULTISPECIES: hypothetical protein [Staphylococcus]|uniref:hypothetical protein n=1 Tax=Staphylococcus TaxID=1279 RepID=UPI000A48A61B|nr:MULTISPECIES: hypothetical protein [Staphylococcus]MDK8645877.1 hypothetical protein [Staphylococcus condimenti]VEG63811.1 Uncharacterised protein [Staphylococcus condimenti]